MKKKNLLSEMAIVYGDAEKSGQYAVTTAWNAVTAGGAKKATAQVRIEFPTGTEKARIYRMLKLIRAFCREQGINLSQAQLCPSPAVRQTETVASVYGWEEPETEQEQVRPEPGQEILITKWIGLGGTLRILWERQKSLEERFPTGFLAGIEKLEPDILTRKEADLARKVHAVLVRPAAEGGILAGLWKLSEETGCGLEIDMKTLPIRQETVEVCEYLGLNPYQLTSTGCLMILSKDGERLAKCLEEAGIPAVRAGRLTSGNDKILHHGEEIRYLDRPAPDEILKLFQ